MPEPLMMKILGHSIGLDRIRNPSLRRVIKERMRCNEFMFNYGDHDEYRERFRYSDYSDHRERYSDWSEHRDAPKVHTDEGHWGMNHRDATEPHWDTYWKDSK